MSEITMRKCDECGRLHGEVNNWWCVIGAPTQPMFVRYEEADRLANEALQEHKNLERLDYCTHKCVVTIFNRWLETGNVVKQELPELVEEEYAKLVVDAIPKEMGVL